MEHTSCAEVRTCVQADGEPQVLTGNLEDNGVFEVAREPGGGYEMTSTTPPVITVDQLIEQIKIGDPAVRKSPRSSTSTEP